MQCFKKSQQNFVFQFCLNFLKNLFFLSRVWYIWKQQFLWNCSETVGIYFVCILDADGLVLQQKGISSHTNNPHHKCISSHKIDWYHKMPSEFYAPNTHQYTVYHTLCTYQTTVCGQLQNLLWIKNNYREVVFSFVEIAHWPLGDVVISFKHTWGTISWKRPLKSPWVKWHRRPH